MELQKGDGYILKTELFSKIGCLGWILQLKGILYISTKVNSFYKK